MGKKMDFDISVVKFDERGLVPAIAQEEATGEVLMLAYMNKESLRKTLETGKATYFSRSRGELWLKGETSGHFQQVKELRYDCDGDTLLLIINQTGAACHTGERSCFYRVLSGGAGGEDSTPATPSILALLSNVLRERKGASADSSYVASLYNKGREAILAKVDEESGELIEAARTGDKKEIVHELADLWFHTMVLLESEDIEMSRIYAEFDRRFGTSGIEEKKSRKKKG